MKQKTDSDIENRLLVAEGWGRGEMEWEFGISRRKILYTEQINRWKVLLCSTGNYIQYPGINHNGKEHERERTYMYNWITLLYSNQHNIVSQLFFN